MRNLVVVSASLFLSFFFFMEAAAQVNPKLDWVKQISGPSREYGYSVTVDEAGYIYTTGTFEGPADFDPGPETVLLTPKGTRDLFISKSDPSGNLLWVKQIGGSDRAVGISIVPDDSGNIIISGLFDRPVDFDPGPETYILDSDYDFKTCCGTLFILKLDPSGNFLWAKGIHTESYMDPGITVAVSSAGDILATGYFVDRADFDPGPGKAIYDAGRTPDHFILKLDSSGEFQWCKHMDGTRFNRGYDIALDKHDNIYTTGMFQETTSFSPGSTAFDVKAGMTADVFISKYNSSGDCQWVKKLGGVNYDAGYSIHLDDSGYVYAAGYFEPIEPASQIPGTGSYNETIFVTKLDSLGETIWIRTIERPLLNRANAVTADDSGYVYITGYINATPHPKYNKYAFYQIADVKMRTEQESDFFISKFDPSGHLLWTRLIGSGGINHGAFVTIDNEGSIITTGHFSSTVDFDPGDGTYNLTADGGDMFIYKLKQCEHTKSVINPAACNSYTSPSGRYTWTNSGTYHDTIPNDAGCDSIIKINLSIHHNTKDTINVRACDSYTSPSEKNNWTTTGTWYDTIPGKAGCDSMLIINLTIDKSSTGSESVTACRNYFWPANNKTYSSSGSYTTILKNSAGCDSIVTLNLKVDKVETSLTKDAISVRSESPGDSYQWIDCDAGNIPVPGAIYQDFSPDAAGRYAVIITRNDCSDTSACITMDAEIPAPENIFFYPNPTRGIITINLPAPVILTATVFDNLGQKIKTVINHNQVDLSEQVSGVYYISVKTETKIHTGKIVKLE